MYFPFFRLFFPPLVVHGMLFLLLSWQPRQLQYTIVNQTWTLQLSLSLKEWKEEVLNREHLRRKSALADFLTAPENQPQKARRGSAAVQQPRMYRAHSQQGAERLELPTMNSSTTPSAAQGRMQRAYSHEGPVPVVIQPLMSPHGKTSVESKAWEKEAGL